VQNLADGLRSIIDEAEARGREDRPNETNVSAKTSAHVAVPA
jgi:hypothetical protein